MMAKGEKVNLAPIVMTYLYLLQLCSNGVANSSIQVNRVV